MQFRKSPEVVALMSSLENQSVSSGLDGAVQKLRVVSGPHGKGTCCDLNGGRANRNLGFLFRSLSPSLSLDTGAHVRAHSHTCTHKCAHI